MLALPLLLAASLDGGAALRHASALSALGPHPTGSPRTGVAALYVASQMREAGLEEVRTVATPGGTNVLGALKTGGSGTIVLAARHDSPPHSPGAWISGGSVGVLVEAARVLAKAPTRSRDILFVSFDGEAGARAFAASLGPSGKDVVGVIVIAGAGWAGGRPVIHAPTYREVSVSGGRVCAPQALVDAALSGGAVLGDPLVPLLYQPTSRLLELDLGGADRALLQAGLPAVLLTETSVAAPFPWRDETLDVPEHLDARALERTAQALVGAAKALQDVPRGESDSMEWLHVFGRTLGSTALALAAALTILPLVVSGVRGGAAGLGLRGVHAALYAVAVLRMPVLALCLLGVPNLFALLRSLRLRLIGLLPLALCVAFGALAARQGLVRGALPGLVDVTVLFGCLVFAFIPSFGGGSKRKASAKAAPKGKRKGLPKR